VRPQLGRIEQVNKELWILLSLFFICLLLNLVVDVVYGWLDPRIRG